MDGIVQAFGSLMYRIVDVGSNIVRGLWQGIQSLAGWLWDKVSAWISSIWDGICDFFGIASPSKEMAWVGKMLVDGLAGSINANGSDAVKAAEHMSDEINGVMANLTSGITGGLSSNISVTGVAPNQSAGQGGSSVSVYVDSLIVREEADINRIAQQLYALEQKALRKKGVVYA